MANAGAFGAHFVEVRVDEDLGLIRVARLVSVIDGGRFLEIFHNRQRHSALGMLTPTEYEILHSIEPVAAGLLNLDRRAMNASTCTHLKAASRRPVAGQPVSG